MHECAGRANTHLLINSYDLIAWSNARLSETGAYYGSRWSAERLSNIKDIYKLYAKGFRGANQIPFLENAQTITGLALAAPTQ